MKLGLLLQKVKRKNPLLPLHGQVAPEDWNDWE